LQESTEAFVWVLRAVHVESKEINLVHVESKEFNLKMKLMEGDRKFLFREIELD